MSAPTEGIAPERPDSASERLPTDSDASLRGEPQIPDTSLADQRSVEDVIERDHPLL